MDVNKNNGELNTQTSTQPGSQPGNNNSDRGEETLTRNQVKDILRGQGKELEKIKAENEALKKAESERIAESEKKKSAKLAEQGEFKSLYEQTKAENEKLNAQLNEMIASKKSRLEKLGVNNAERIKALPKEMRSLIHPNLGIEDQAEQITSLEKMITDQKLRIHGGAGVTPQDTGPLTHEQKMENWAKMGAKMFEKGDKK